MVVTGSSVNQVHVVDKGIAYTGSDGTGESRDKGCSIAGCLNHGYNRSPDDCPTGGSCSVTLASTLKWNVLTSVLEVDETSNSFKE